MKSILFILSLLFSALTFTACRQAINKKTQFNLDFELIENGLPTGWELEGRLSDFFPQMDSIVVRNGKFSFFIDFNNCDLTTSPVMKYALPDNYSGKKITLSGFIKTENITEGYAGLLLRLEPEIAFGNMYWNGITGTTDWTKHEITIDMYPEQTQQIIVGIELYGRGKIWMDDFKVTIDGKDIETIPPYKPKPFPAKNDRAFDKGSNIIFPELDEQKIHDLELLGRIWGFLKYHHLAIAKGKYNWDNELFRMLPDYLKVNNNKQRDKFLVKWINKYGRINQCRNCQATSGSAFIKPDLSWIEHSNISMELKHLLHKIYLNRNQGNHYYIRIQEDGGNPVFSNERTYEAMDYPDAGFRLLTLYRYWNIIHYFYPNTYMTDKDWNTVLSEYIPRFLGTENRLAYELTASMLIGEICDSHAFLVGFYQMESLRGRLHVPVQVQFIENRLVVVENYTDNAVIKKGDIITHIDGKKVEAIVDSIKNYYPASNEATRVRDLANDLLRTNKNTMLIDYISSGKIGQKEIYTLDRSYWHYFMNRSVDNSNSYRFINKDIGYINMQTLKCEAISLIKQEFNKTKGIIIDIRNYPPAYVVYSLGSFFVPKATSFAKTLYGNSGNPGEFIFTQAHQIPESEDHYNGQLVVIVNEYTQSAAEDLVMAFQAGDNTVIIGSATAGADGRISAIHLPGGLKTYISGVGFYYPDGRQMQRTGIVPDIEIKPTIQGIREGNDELLEKAIEVIQHR